EEAAGRNAAGSGDHQGGVAPKVVTVPAKRELVRYAQSRGLSESPKGTGVEFFPQLIDKNINKNKYLNNIQFYPPPIIA
ncbi:MAG: hypothetical protein AB7E73_07020, partial [Burkholderiales bacterium]